MMEFPYALKRKIVRIEANFMNYLKSLFLCAHGITHTKDNARTFHYKLLTLLDIVRILNFR